MILLVFCQDWAPQSKWFLRGSSLHLIHAGPYAVPYKQAAEKPFRHSSATMADTFGTRGERTRRIAERDSRDGRDEVGIQSVYVAPFSYVSRFTRHGLWRWRTFSASC